MKNPYEGCNPYHMTTRKEWDDYYSTRRALQRRRDNEPHNAAEINRQLNMLDWAASEAASRVDSLR